MRDRLGDLGPGKFAASRRLNHVCTPFRSPTDRTERSRPLGADQTVVMRSSVSSPDRRNAKSMPELAVNTGTLWHHPLVRAAGSTRTMTVNGPTSRLMNCGDAKRPGANVSRRPMFS